MLILKKFNVENIKEEYQALQIIPPFETGFENPYAGMTFEEFSSTGRQKLLAHDLGLDLEPNHVPETYYFLWDDEEIVGLFKFRQYLSDSLKKGAGHIGYTILPNFRNRGLAKRGLQLLIQKQAPHLKESEFYLSVSKGNLPSLKTQLANGATIVAEDDLKFYTRIPKKREDVCIWDLDGTLVDSYEVILDSLEELFRHHFNQLINRTEIREYILTNSVHQLLQNIATEKQIDFQLLHDHYASIQEKGDSSLKEISNALYTLTELHHRGVRHYIYTHKGPSAETVIKKLGFQPYIEKIIDASAGFPRKPDPTALLYLLREEKLLNKNCWYIGDRTLDEGAGKNAQMNRILLIEENSPVTAQYSDTLVVKDLKEILPYFELGLSESS